MRNKAMQRNRRISRILAGALCLSLTAGLAGQAQEEELIVEEFTEEAPTETPQDIIEPATEVEDPTATEPADAAPPIIEFEGDGAETEATIVVVGGETEMEAGTEADTIVIENAEEVEPAGDAADAQAVSPVHVCVHDPSIVKAEDGAYYVLGSHTASAKSNDLIKWEQVNFDYKNPHTNAENLAFYGTLQETFAVPFQWAGYNDGDCAGGGYAIWAPDAIWNPYYEWEDGTTGAWLLYCCTSSTWRRSCICYLAAKEFEGPYTYVDTIVYSGFTTNGTRDGNSSRDTTWDNDYLNLKSLVEKGSANGGIDEISDKWFDAGGSWNNLYAPNAIDPNLFFDASGEKLYMSYGSWSGGLFLLELDPKTGAAIYPGTDSVDEVSGNFVDRYFGVHLAGGNHQSGEAPYIRYDAETGYYYLYETYGGLTAEGGYNMRLFRSENPTGPYLDAKGGNAADSGDSNDNYGIKLIGNYSFYDQIGKRAAGHNSALIDEDGSHYLVYHQRFDVDPQLEAHEVRVHQQFLNEEGWPVTAVYEYRGEQPTHYEDSEIVGSYEFIDHDTKTNGNMLDTQMLTLNEDGTVSGAAKGTWTKSDSGKGFDYVTFEMNDVVYKGYFFRQHKENAEELPVMTFSAIGSNNTSIWGSMIDMQNEDMLANMAAVSVSQMIPSATREDLELPTSVMGADVAWTSSDPAVISETGKVTGSSEEDTRAKLTATVTYGNATAEVSCKVTVRQNPYLICRYDFEAPADGTAVAPADGSLAEAAELVGSAAITEDAARGKVLQITSEEGAKNVNYLKLPEDTLSAIRPAGYTVAMWVNIGADTFEHSALFEADADNQYPLTRIGANLIARINANAYSDVQGALLTTSGERDTWQHVVYTVDPLGIRVYLNGELVGEEEKNLAECFKKNKTGISGAKNVYVGSGAIWGDEDVRSAMFDDVAVYFGALTATEVQALYNEG